MLSFADLISLVLTFFVMMYAISAIEQPRWEKVIRSFYQRLNPGEPQVHEGPTEQLSITKEDLKQAKDLQYLYTIISEKFLSNELSAKVLHAQLVDDQLILSLPSDVAFLPGKDELAPKARDIINFLGDVVGTIGNHIDVVGYADPTPPATGSKYPSNWELSLARALVVSNILKSQGYLYKISIFGRGSSTTEDLSADVPKNERYQFLRRVDIVIRANRAEL
jgi:chemotaxis protein MotB